MEITIQSDKMYLPPKEKKDDKKEDKKDDKKGKK